MADLMTREKLKEIRMDLKKMRAETKEFQKPGKVDVKLEAAVAELVAKANKAKGILPS